ncbi:MAG: aldo/keto reductase [Bacteroidales bacterium]|nr:aldo/keto reductase [Bacteroidales bacterium]
MNQRLLGKTGIKVSEIAFGGVEIGLPYGIGVKSEADMLSESEAINLLHSAIDHGINFFDTARGYGGSESIMGRAYNDRRDKVIICTKCRHFRNSDGTLPQPDKLKEIIENSLKESLAALQTDYVDVYMLHQADIEILRSNTISRIFSDLKNSGMIRATGVSTYSMEETEKAIECGNWDVIQLPFNLMDQQQEALFSFASQRGVGIMVRSVLFKGILTDRGRNLHPELKKVENHLKLYDELLDESGFDLSTLATKFALSFDEVSSILVGIDRIDYLHKSLAAADGLCLDQKMIARAKELCYPEPEFLDLPVWDKKGWLK